MRERAKKIGGLLEIRSEPGKGTQLAFTLPAAKNVS
jgi:signal transduction histidine kinase